MAVITFGVEPNANGTQKGPVLRDLQATIEVELT
jgi:hypothetical protein